MIPLGGCEEIGKNMTVIEWLPPGRPSEIIIVDLGLKFPEEDQPGIDYIIPDTSYLRGREKNIKGVLISHGHYDHIGAIPHLAPKLGNPPIFGTALTLGIIRKRQEDYKGVPPLRLQEIKAGENIKLGVFTVEPFFESHNIPDAVGLIIHTPYGPLVYTGDFKFDFGHNGAPSQDIAKIAVLSDRGVLALLSDSTGAESPGRQLSETDIAGTLDDIFQKTKGRLIVGTFSSLLSRVQQIITLAEKYGRKVAPDGYSMKTNIELAHQLGYLKFNKSTLINVEHSLDLPADRTVILCTGAQGEGRAVLMRIANREHRFLRVVRGDTIVFSSSVIPGNERMVQRLKDSLARQGAEVIHYQMMDVHAGGHGKQEDLKLMIKLVSPRYFIPIHGNYSFLVQHAKLAAGLGIPQERIFVPENGQVIEFDKRGGKITNRKVPVENVMVDGLGVGDVSQVVLRDRQVLASEGIVVVIATVDGRTGQLVTSPDIISRGFVYLRESKQLIEEVRRKVKKILHDKDPKSGPIESYLKDKIRNNIGQFLFTKTERRPMIIPVVIEV